MRQFAYLALLFISSVLLVSVIAFLDEGGGTVREVFSLGNLGGFTLYTPFFFGVLWLLHQADMRLGPLPIVVVLMALALVFAALFLAFTTEPTSISEKAQLLLVGSMLSIGAFLGQKIPALLLSVQRNGA